MGGNDYRKVLTKRIESTFFKWREQEVIKEKELYRFLNTLKRTSGIIGLKELFKFCVSHLDILMMNSDGEIPVRSLDNFQKKVMQLLDEREKPDESSSSDFFDNRFDEEMVLLIIDDDLEFVSVVKEMLEKLGAQVVIALTGKRGLELFYAMRPNIVLIDISLSDMEGFDIIDQIGNVAQARNIPIAIMSLDTSPDYQKKAYERGAMDFIAKPLNQEVFIAYLFNRDKMRKLLDKSIVTDGLTGVGNRRHFDEVIHYFEEMKHRTGIIFSLVMLDLDHFKNINDTYGHPAGDEVLRKLGEIALENKRDTDFVFRYGGEEFTFLINDAVAEEAVKLIDRIRRKFNKLIFLEEDQSFSVTFSAGVATYNGDVDQLILDADQALFKAKRSGRNKTIIYDTDIIVVKQKLNIMIVDHDRLSRTMLYDKLTSWKMPDIDISVSVYGSGTSFLVADWYNKDEQSIILLDALMPDIGGLEVLSHMRKEFTEKNVKILMMATRTEDADIKAALWLGADDYIIKPAKPNDVLIRIQQLTSRMFA